MLTTLGDHTSKTYLPTSHLAVARKQRNVRLLAAISWVISVIDFSAYMCFPHCVAFWKYLACLQTLVSVSKTHRNAVNPFRNSI